MADEIDVIAPEPEVQEVEQINEAYDANDVIVDDDGNIVQAFDREKNITYVVKGKGVSQPKAATDPEPVVPEKKVEKADDDDDDEKVAGDYINAADYVLKKTGYTKDEVDLGDGQIVKIADLTEQQQLDLMVAEFESTTSSYEDRIKELESKPAELKFEDPMAQQLVDYLKEGGDIKKLAKEILSKDPAAQAKMLSDDEIIKLGIKKEFPSFTDEDVEEEFKEMSESRRARRAKALRQIMETQKPDFSSLTAEQKELNAQAVLARQKDFEAEVGVVKTASAELKEIAGIPVNDQVLGFLLKQVLPEKMEDDSNFVKGLSDNPKKLLTLQFWDTYGEKVLEATRAKYYEMGLKEGNKGKENLSDEPVRTYSTGSRNEKKVIKKSLDEFSEKEWKDFVDGSKF